MFCGMGLCNVVAGASRRDAYNVMASDESSQGECLKCDIVTRCHNSATLSRDSSRSSDVRRILAATLTLAPLAGLWQIICVFAGTSHLVRVPFWLRDQEDPSGTTGRAMGYVGDTTR